MSNNTIKFARLITFLLVFIHSNAGYTKNMTIFDFSFEDIDGNLVNLNKFKGKPIFISQLEFTQYFPKDGWVEHNPEEIWSTT